jgi:hypothetical protein
MTSKVLARLRDLRTGRIFWDADRKCKLLYCNGCRARVRLPKVAKIKGKTIKTFTEIDWAPNTVVLVEVKQRPITAKDLQEL